MKHTFALPSDIESIAAGLGDDARKFSGRTVLLCGGAGFLGRYFSAVFRFLNESVLDKPCRLIICDNLIVGLDPKEDAGFMETDFIRFVRHDIVEPLHIDEPVDYVIQAAGIASPYYYRKYPLETLEVATTGTKRTLDFAREKNVMGYVFFSSSEIYGDPDPKHVPTSESYRGNVSCLGPRACYDESKRVGETLCAVYHEQFGLPTKMIRPFNIYGPGMRETDYRVLPNFASRIIGGKPLMIYGKGDQTRTFCYITDGIVGFLKVLLDGAPGQPYNIGNPRPEVSMLDLAKALEKVEGRDLAVTLVEYPDSYPADEPMRRCPDISKAALQLKYKPEVGLEDGLARFMKWAKETYTGSPF